MTLLSLVTASATASGTAPAFAADLDADEHTCSIWYIRGRLGRRDYRDKRIVRLVTALIQHQHFPPPLPCLKGQQLTSGVTAKSMWLRPAVDAWLDDFLPPANLVQLDDAARARAADEMDANAANLSRVGGGKR